MSLELYLREHIKKHPFMQPQDIIKLCYQAANGAEHLLEDVKAAEVYFKSEYDKVPAIKGELYEKISDDVIGPILKKLEARMQNIVLIGMPGWGKSTVGKLLSGKTGRKFVDADEETVRMAGKSIPEIFARDGEEAFREYETQVLSELGKQSGLIIATGGGCVTKERNYPLLHQNGTIFWIQRELDSLPTDGRPLSQRNSIGEMYRIRQPLYEAWMDRMVDNNSNPEEAAGEILRVLEV